MSDAVGELSVLVRSLYDRRYAFLGLKKINEVIPAEDYRLLEDVYASLGCGNFPGAAQTILGVLDAFLANADNGLAPKLDARFLTWAREGLGAVLFAERGNVLSVDAPITSPHTYEEFWEGLDSGSRDPSPDRVSPPPQPRGPRLGVTDYAARTHKCGHQVRAVFR